MMLGNASPNILRVSELLQVDDSDVRVLRDGRLKSFTVVQLHVGCLHPQYTQKHLKKAWSHIGVMKKG